MKDSVITENQYARGNLVYRFHWSAIFAGTFVGLGLGFLLHLYATAISLSAYSSSQQGAYVIAIGGFLGMLLGVIAAMGTAGFVSGYLARLHCFPQQHGGILYGFITWALIIFFSAMMIKPIGHYLDSVGHSLSRSKVMDNGDSRKISLNINADDKANKAQDNALTSQSASVTPKQLAYGGWIIFALFFLGALSSCIGACVGMNCKCNHPEKTPPAL